MSCSSNPVTPQHRMTPLTPATASHAAVLMDPLNASYSSSNNNMSASDYTKAAFPQSTLSTPDVNPGSGNFVDSFRRTPNFTAPPIEKQNSGFSSRAEVPLRFSRIACNKVDMTYSDPDSETRSSQQAIHPISQSAVSISSAIGGSSPEVASQHHPKAFGVSRSKMIPSIPDVATSSAEFQIHSGVQKLSSVNDQSNTMPSNTNCVVEDTCSSDGGSSDSTVLEEPLKHLTAASMASRSDRNKSRSSSTSRNKRKLEGGVELSPKMPKFSQQIQDRHFRKSTRDKALRLRSSVNISSGDKIQEEQKPQTQFSQNQSKSRVPRSEKSNAKPSPIKDSQITTGLPEPAPQQKQSSLRTSKTAARKSTRESVRRSDKTTEQERIVTEKPAQKKINSSRNSDKTISKTNLEESLQLFNSHNDESSSSSEEGSVYMSPKHATPAVKNETESDSQTEEDIPRATNKKVAKRDLSAASNKEKGEKSPGISSELCELSNPCCTFFLTQDKCTYRYKAEVIMRSLLL